MKLKNSILQGATILKQPLKTNLFNTIGVGVAFSPNLKANIYEAARLSLIFNSKLFLIHVGERTEDKELQLKQILSPFIDKKLSCEFVFQNGDPVDVILTTIEKLGIGLIVLGALQRENFLKYYLGSIARKIARNVKCSVLLLTNPSVERVPCKHIVVNGLKDPKTKPTIESAFFFAKKLSADKVTIVEEITKQEVSVKVFDDRSLRRLKIAKERIKLREDSRVKSIINEVSEDYKTGVVVKTQPIFGKRGYSIGHYAQFVRADLLVMNSPSETTFWNRLFPHDIEHILTELPTNVLIVR